MAVLLPILAIAVFTIIVVNKKKKKSSETEETELQDESISVTNFQEV